jgi:hypothetical protein
MSAGGVAPPGGPPRRDEERGWLSDLRDALLEPERVDAEIGRARSRFVADAVDDEDRTTDLLLAGKTSHYVQTVVAQAEDPSLAFFCARRQAYAKRSLEEYTRLLGAYYREARARPDRPVQAPALQFQMIDRGR